YFKSGGPFKCRKGWGKSSLHEGGIRMPFVVSWGDRLKPGRSSYMGQFTDLMPTFAELAGAKAPTHDGISFVPTLKGQQQPQHEYLYWEFPASNGWLAVRQGPWKGLVQNVQKGNCNMKLYNLDEDPQESRDLAVMHPEIIEEMWHIIENEHCEVPSHNPKFELDINVPE
ncbi:MAG: sulfatase-like hydrolase/transferase, partial [Bacteroidales bacterium]|nr:sulfatase-like hydrolase/transferase [Bacteroidales bacterium]